MHHPHFLVISVIFECSPTLLSNFFPFLSLTLSKLMLDNLSKLFFRNTLELHDTTSFNYEAIFHTFLSRYLRQ